MSEQKKYVLTIVINLSHDSIQSLEEGPIRTLGVVDILSGCAASIMRGSDAMIIMDQKNQDGPPVGVLMVAEAGESGARLIDDMAAGIRGSGVELRKVG
jgi:hypothetical protein